MRSIRALLALLAVIALPGCDALLGPDNDPADIEISADSTTFDLLGDTLMLTARVRNGSGDVLGGASVSWSSRNEHVVSVDNAGLVTAVGNGEAWVVGRSGGAMDSIRFTVDSPIPCAPDGELSVPDTLSAEISFGHCDLDGRFYNVWRVEVTRYQLMTFDLVSPDFNALLYLLDANGGVVASDDDSGINFNARLLVELDPGVYYAFATSANRGLTGSYQLAVFAGAHPTPCPATADVAFPDTVSGTLDAGGCQYQGFSIDVWRLNLPQPDVVTLQLEGVDFGAYLAVTDTLGRLVAQADLGPNAGSWTELTLPAGPYDLWVSPRTPGDTGDYTLEVMQGPSLLECPTEGTVAVGEAVEGDVATDDCYVWFVPADGWKLTLTDTTDIQLALNTDPIDPVLLVADSIGRPLYFDLSNGTYLRMDTTMVPGTYTIRVLSGNRAAGGYRMSVVERGQLGVCDPVGTVVLDSTYEGALATTDCTMIDGRYTDVRTLHVDSAVTATFDLTSDKFDTFLIVADTLGTAIAQDDDSGPVLNSSLTLALDSGTYHVWTTSYSAGELGGYQLDLTTGAPLADRDTGEAETGKPGAMPRPEDPIRWLQGVVGPDDPVGAMPPAWVDALPGWPGGR